jgi:hypothetical protein
MNITGTNPFAKTMARLPASSTVSTAYGGRYPEEKGWAE